MLRTIRHIVGTSLAMTLMIAFFTGVVMTLHSQPGTPAEVIALFIPANPL